VVPDVDAAGSKFLPKMVEALRPFAASVWVATVPNPDGQAKWDVTDWVEDHDPDTVVADLLALVIPANGTLPTFDPASRSYVVGSEDPQPASAEPERRELPRHYQTGTYVKQWARLWTRDRHVLGKASAEKLLVLERLADDANWDDGEKARTGIKVLADLTGHHERTVRRYLKLGVEVGALEVVEKGGGKGKATVYRLIHPDLERPEAPE
jgi:hypothetical protein